MKKARKIRKDKDRNEIYGTKTDTNIRKSLISKLLGDGGHRFNRLMKKLEEADDEGFGYIDEETFLDTIFIHLRTRHRPNIEESQWLVEQLHVKNKRMNLIAYKEFRALITGDHINISPKRNAIKKYTVPSFVDRANYPYPYPGTISYYNNTGLASTFSELGGTGETHDKYNSAIPYPHQNIMNQSTPMNRWRNVELSDDEEDGRSKEKENSRVLTPMLKNDQNMQWATRTGSVGEWLEYQATPMERMNLEELLEIIENYIVDKGLNSGTDECPAGVGRPTQDGISLKIGPSLEVKLSFHTNC